MKTVLKIDTPHNYEFDSDEEMYFFWWARELMIAGYIEKIVHQPESFQLSESIWCEYHKQQVRSSKYVNEELLAAHKYTTDFYIEWNPDKLNEFATPLFSDLKKKEKRSFKYLLAEENIGHYFSYVEVKPAFDQNNMTRLAKINQKWVYEKFGNFINIVIPEKHFNKTFTPCRYFQTNKSMKLRKIKYSNQIRLADYLGMKIDIPDMKQNTGQQPMF